MGTTDGLSRQGVASAEQTHPILLALTAGPSPEGGAAFLEEVRSACGEDHFHQAPVPETAPVSPHVVLLVLERPCAQQVDRVRQALPQTPVVLVLPATGEPADWLQATHDVGAHDFLSVADRDPRLICRVVHSARTHLHNETTRRRHQILLDKSPDGFWINDLEGQIREVNPAFAAMVGYSPAELTGMRINDLELEEDAEATRHHIQVILDRGSDRFATRHRHKDGGVVHLDVSAHFVEEGPGRVMAVFRDISSEKEARVAKERLTERLRLATSAAGLGIWDLDLESGYLEWDAGMFRIYGVAETDFSHSVEDWRGALTADTRDQALADIEAGMASREPYTSEFRIRRGDGAVRYIRALAQAILDDKGQPRRVVGVNEDVTEQRAAEQQLNEKTRQLTAVLETAGDAVITADAAGRIHYFNPVAETMFGYSAEQMVGNRLNELMPEPYASRHDDYMARYEHSGERRVIGIGRELEAVRADGTRFPVELNVSDTGLQDPRLFVGIIRDVTERKAAEAALAEIRENLDEAQRIAGMGSWELDVATGDLWWSDQAYRLFGLEPGAMEPSYAAFLEFVHPEDRAPVRQRVEAAFGGSAYALEHRILRRDGAQRWVYERGEVAFGPEGEPVSMRGTVLDVTERRELEDAVRQERDTAHGIINSLPGVFYMITPEPRLVLWNRNLREVLGREAAELDGMDPLEIIAPAMRPQAEAEINRVFAEGFGRLEAQLNAGDGSRPPYDLSAYRIDLEGGPLMVGLGIDVSRRVTLEQELRRMATTDPLTGLPNRRQFWELAETEQARAERHGRPFSLLMLDVDHFKSVNDTHGHETGDQVLMTLAQVVRDTLRDEEVIGRLGGEEFAVLLPETDGPGADRAAERIRSRLAETPVQKEWGPLHITASLGVAEWAPGQSIEHLLAQADAALYQSKAAGRNRVTRLRK